MMVLQDIRIIQILLVFLLQIGLKLSSSPGPKSVTNNPIRHYDRAQKIPESFAGSRKYTQYPLYIKQQNIKPFLLVFKYLSNLYIFFSGFLGKFGYFLQGFKVWYLTYEGLYGRVWPPDITTPSIKTPNNPLSSLSLHQNHILKISVRFICG